MKSNRSVVCVLMSTYNGEKYLKQQIDSILEQDGVKTKLIVRDDGSIDNTHKILNFYQENGDLEWYKGNNKGSAYSFWDLLLNSPECDYYCFSDQDDVWMKDKLLCAVKKLKTDTSSLYFGKKIIVDEHLNVINKDDEYVRGVTLEFSLLKGFAAGCTMVFNKKLRDALLEYQPEVMTMHDSWIMRVAGAIGEIYYDKNPHMYYRQHRQNVVGNQTRWTNLKRHIKKNVEYKNDTDRSTMAQQLLDHYGGRMKSVDFKYTSHLADIRQSTKARFSLCFSSYLKTQHPVDILAYKIFFLLGWL